MIGIRFEFTNNGDNNQTFDSSIYVKAFQDGIQMDETSLSNETEESENSYKEIKPGATLTCEKFYKISSSFDVELEVEGFSSNGNKLIKTFMLNREG